MPKDFLKDAKSQYDVVVIGSGLAGLIGPTRTWSDSRMS